MLTVDNQNVSHDTFYVRSSDSDMYYMATLPFYFSVMQEMGAGHAAKMGVGIEDLYRKYKYTWVISRTKVRFFQHAAWRDSLDLESWAQENVRLHCPRVINGSVGGNSVFQAMTLWAVVDVERKRPVRPRQVLDELNLANPEEHFQEPGLAPLPDWEEAAKLEILPPYEAKPFFYNVDINGHINNVIYIEWLIHALPSAILQECEAEMFDVRWERQTYKDDILTVETARTSENSFIHRIQNQAGQTVFSAVSSWRERKNKIQPLGREL